MDRGVSLIERLYELLDAGDVERVAMLYAPDAEIVRYDRVARTSDEVVAYFRTLLADHPGWQLRSIDPIRQVDDVILWDALVDTDHGVLQTVDVVIVDADGRIRRHIPGLRGYWGD